MANTAIRDQAINIRATREQRDLIDQAASLQGKSRSDFMLESACREATSVMLDRVFFHLDSDSFDRFAAMLDEPAPPSAKLRNLLSTRPPWE